MAELELTAASDVATKLKDLEERHALLREKVLLLGQSLLKQEERISKELALMKDEIREMSMDTERTKEAVRHVIAESSDFARKEELATVEKYMKIWEPLKFVREEDVERIVDEALKSRQTKTL